MGTSTQKGVRMRIENNLKFKYEFVGLDVPEYPNR